MCVWQVKLCDPSLTRAIPERLRDEFLMTTRYTNLLYVYITLLRSAPTKKNRRADQKTAFRSIGLKDRSHQVSQRNATQRDATRRTAFSANTLSLFNVFNYCGAA